MRIITFDSLPSHVITQFGSVHATISGITRGDAPFQLAFLRLEPGGILGAHPAVTPQLLVVIAGEGRVSGGDSVKHPLHQGITVHWDAGETHETTTDTGLTALVLESEGISLPPLPGDTPADSN